MIVSFIIVALNAENVLNNILSDLEKQTYDHKKIEVVLVDSFSSDKTKSIMEKFKQKNLNNFIRVVILDNPKKILPCGWNVALKNSFGDIILRVDAHTRIPTDFIELNVKTQLEGHKICGGQVKSILLDESDWKKCLYIVEKSSFCGGASDFRKEGENRYVDTLGFASYNREVFEKVGGYDERLARTEDNEMHYRMRKNGYKFWLNTDIMSYRYLRSSLGKMIKQKFLNGKWVGLTLSISPKCLSKFYFAPFTFLIALLICIVLSATVTKVFLVALLVVYFAAAIYSTIKCVSANKFKPTFISIPFLFFILHIAYGLGTLVGIIKIPFWRNKRENLSCDEIQNVKNILLKNKYIRSEQVNE